MRSSHFPVLLIVGIMIAHTCEGDKKSKKQNEMSKELVRVELDRLNH